LRNKNSRKDRKKCHVMEPTNTINIDEFEKGTKEKTNTLMRFGGLRQISSFFSFSQTLSACS
jgi:hypothetical protein